MPQDLERIKQASQGLFYMSETDHPLELVELKTTEAASVPAELIAMANKPGCAPEEQTVDYFFRNHTKQYPEDDAEQKNRVKKFEMLIKVLTEELSNIKVYRIGTIQIDAFIIGKTKSGKYAGLKTKIVET